MPITTVLLVRYAGGYREVVDAGAVASRGRLEGFLTLGVLPTEADVDAVGAGVLGSVANPRVATVAGIEPDPADEPYVGFGLGDTVTMPDETGSPGLVRVRSIAVGEDPEGNPIFGPEVNAAPLEVEERLQRWLRSLANGSLGGAVAAASPAGGGGGPGLVTTAPTAVAGSGSIGGSGSGGVTMVVATAAAPTAGWTWPRLPVPVSRRCSRLDITAGTAASSGTTTVNLLRNGAIVGTVTLAAGATDNYASGLDVLFEPGQFLSFSAPAVGTGLANLLVSARFG